MEQIFANNFLFENLSTGDLEHLVTLARKKDFTNGQMVFTKGDPATGMMAVLSGQIRILNYSTDGKEIILRMVNPGEVFGEIALIDGGERTAEARAMGKTTLLLLERNDFLPFLEDNPKLCIQLMNVLCQRLRATSEQLEDFSFLDLRLRLAKCLSHMAEQQQALAPSKNGVKLSINQKMLAAMVGTTREAVNKRLREWEDGGIIELSRGAITVLDTAALNNIVE